ncbi:protein trichome birefringence-like 34 [Salvia splendens]|uniref:protein trichome birefringence-like 34 n=1 Tax=Salvia splendens TaxID=180675 RepID=UPI001C2702F5|nr:protein trichome birefringence-like 34 [Salvia splendens]
MGAVRWKSVVKYFPLTVVLMLALYLIDNSTSNVVTQENLVIFKENKIVTNNNTISGCDLFSGKWVYDDVSYPLYKEGECTMMEDSFACEKSGRKNLKYQNWRWQPHQCDLPRFNGTALLEKLRNKKLIFVGDSLGRNQWRSFICLIEPYLPPLSRRGGVSHNLFDVFGKHVKEYNATIRTYWSPYLVESNCDDPIRHSADSKPTIRFQSIEKHGRNWINADVLIFDTFAWWTVPDITLLWGSLENSNAIYKQVKMSVREYEVALNTWSEWVEFQVDRNRTKIFFMSASPFRLGKTHWGTSPSCYNITKPIFDETYWANGVDRNLMEIVESTLKKLEERGIKVEYMNATQLSGYREDARPSIYRPFLKVALKDITPNKYADCLHWCLPGVPDVWNQILYAYIMKS